MMEFLGGLWNGFVGFISILLPFGKGPKIWHLGPTGRWILHFVLLILPQTA